MIFDDGYNTKMHVYTVEKSLFLFPFSSAHIAVHETADE